MLFIKLIPLFCSTMSLTELEISKNFISGASLKELSYYFMSHMKNLEKMNFSNNWIDSFGAEEFIKNVFGLAKVVIIDLSNNFLDNEFLKSFDFYLRKVKHDKQEITFDLSRNMFDPHLSKYKIFSFDEEDKKSIKSIKIKQEKKYSLMNFMDNLAYYLFYFSKMKAKVKIKIDIIKHYKEKDLEVSKKLLESVKYYKIKVKTTPVCEEILKLSQFRVFFK